MRDSYDDAIVDDEMEPNPDLNRLTNAIIGAAIAVHRTLGPGHLESAYQRALEIELDHVGIPYKRQYPVTLRYRGQVVGEGRLDFLVEDKVIVDLKATESISPVFVAQMISYLKITHLKLGLILKFKFAVLTKGIRRIAN
jgi:GxxExxY protein